MTYLFIRIAVKPPAERLVLGTVLILRLTSRDARALVCDYRQRKYVVSINNSHIMFICEICTQNNQPHLSHVTNIWIRFYTSTCAVVAMVTRVTSTHSLASVDRTETVARARRQETRICSNSCGGIMMHRVTQKSPKPLENFKIETETATL